MVYRGRVANGVVVLEGPHTPPEGAPVSVRILKSPARRAGKKARKPKTLYDCFRSVVGIVKDLPPDFATNHDFYLYGGSKQK